MSQVQAMKIVVKVWMKTSILTICGKFLLLRKAQAKFRKMQRKLCKSAPVNSYFLLQAKHKSYAKMIIVTQSQLMILCKR